MSNRNPLTRTPFLHLMDPTRDDDGVTRKIEDSKLESFNVTMTTFGEGSKRDHCCPCTQWIQAIYVEGFSC